MNEERRKIIVQEIEQWRRGKLLPDQYCDFLLNLYGEPDERPPSHSLGKAAFALQRATGRQWLLGTGLFFLICFVVFYFSAFHPLLQIGLVALAVTVLLRIGHKRRTTNESAGLAVIGTAMLLLLGAGLLLLEMHGLSGWGWKAAFIAGCAALWIVYGLGADIPLLHLCGWVAAVLAYGWVLSRYTDLPAWYEVQLFWLPLSCAFGWSSWFVQRWSKRASSVLFAVCALLWFMPELYAAVYLRDMEWLELQLLVKIAAGGALLYGMRKKWIAWVA